MKMKQTLIIPTIALAMVVAPSINLFESVQAKASTLVENEPSHTVENLKDTGTEQSFTLILNDDAEVDFNIEKTDDTLELKTVTSTEDGIEEHLFEYVAGDEFATMDGEKVSIDRETFVESELQNEEFTNSPQLLKASSPSTPVYISSGKIKIGKPIKTLGAIVTVIGGGIAVAAFAGVTIATSAIANTVSGWASVVGLGTLTAGYLFDGNITYKQYRTKGQISTGYGNNKQTAYRYQDIRAVGTVKNKKMDKQLKSTGSWYFASKPW
ncbi:hypothetical protein BMT55_04335 [Listeria newyorkensis]|uniref:Uncharacterized protein n=1 Tax=Listeria newyorkensis TaxID=1497681 RepID=A0ABX4XPJ7_9LIST|nr:hypothetical protein [Listeria newyorkensis]KGL41881.1 hypothetical protein EP58_10065 [Listeria newyorkensis]KMT62173.1 hypothetical protein X559_1470 [Listeria newyorkensis]PNP93999.1 hypothetical protein BMT55_04335 [Listeria newyorkensis]WAO22625.1 hypothetical protein OTR81_04965 [Listeria newyorkensis]SQC51515.1 Uncharacterised protein [Listeria newyorkensis]